jgi:hypothetical protein
MPQIDTLLERSAKAGAILIPVILFYLGQIYTEKKAEADRITLRQEQIARAELERANLDQKNTELLLSLLKSSSESDRLMAIDIFVAKSQRGQAPLDLLPVIQRLQRSSPAEVGAAVTAAESQKATCVNRMPDGVYVHYQDKDQKEIALRLGESIKAPQLTFQGSQRVDVAPRQTELRYYPAGAKAEDLTKITQSIEQLNLGSVKRSDISYLLHGCPARPVYEIWIGAKGEGQ